jgi:uncharacterized membrane protein
MERIEKSIDVLCPIKTVYNQWTQFEEFPRFMKGIKKVTQLDNKRLHWEAEIAGKDRSGTLESRIKSPIIGLPGKTKAVNTHLVLSTLRP